MIQQICLSSTKSHEHVNFDEPIELMINAKDYNKFEKIISLLFDEESVRRIKKIKAEMSGSQKLAV